MNLKICILILKILNQMYFKDKLVKNFFNLNLFKI